MSIFSAGHQKWNLGEKTSSTHSGTVNFADIYKMATATHWVVQPAQDNFCKPTRIYWVTIHGYSKFGVGFQPICKYQIASSTPIIRDIRTYLFHCLPTDRSFCFRRLLRCCKFLLANSRVLCSERNHSEDRRQLLQHFHHWQWRHSLLQDLWVVHNISISIMKSLIDMPGRFNSRQNGKFFGLQLWAGIDCRRNIPWEDRTIWKQHSIGHDPASCHILPSPN